MYILLSNLSIFSKFFHDFLLGGGNKNQAGFTHPLCRQNPDPYFHRGCGSNVCHFLNRKKCSILKFLFEINII